MLTLVGTFLITCLAGTAVMPLVIRQMRAHAVLDIPNARSSHSAPIPRGGGVGVVVVYILTVISMGFIQPQGIDGPTLLLAASVAALFVLGFLDDLYSLRVSTRIAVQGLVAAIAVVVLDLTVDVVWLPPLPAVSLWPVGVAIAWLWLVGFANVFNFMDGINGLAGAQGVIAALSLSIVAAATGDASLSLGLAAMAGACLGFLRYNCPRAHIFLGDGGSLPVGFCLGFGILRISTQTPEQCPFVVMLLAVWPFLFDGLTTLMRRVARRQRLGDAHREHLYQLLVRSGVSHGAVTLGYSAVGIICAGLMLLVTVGRVQAGILGFHVVAVVSTVCAFAIIRRYARWQERQIRQSAHESVTNELAALYGSRWAARLPDRSDESAGAERDSDSFSTR